MSLAYFYNKPELDLGTIEKSQTYLVVGQVQLGKTKFMIDTCIKAFKNEYDCVIILGSNNKNLLNQTRTRLKMNLIEKN